MARTLGDVLHLFLDEVEPEGPAGAPTPAPAAQAPTEAAPQLIACIAAVSETLQAAIAWNLAAATAALGTPSTWLGADREPAPEASLPAGMRQVRPGPSPLERAQAVLEAEGTATWLQLMPQIDMGAALLGHTLHFAATDAGAVAECLRRMEAVHSQRPDGAISVLIHGSGSAHEGEAAFERLAEAARSRLGRAPEAAGILGDEAEIYRSIVARRPVCLQAADCPTALGLFDAARRLAGPAISLPGGLT